MSRARVTWQWVRIALWAAFVLCVVLTGFDQACLFVAYAATIVSMALALTDKNWRK